jgi:hypothetical protein
MRFVEIKDGHGLFHYLIVIFLRIAKFVFYGTIGIYSTAIGYILLKNTAENFFSQKVNNSINKFYAQLPYFFQIKDFILIKLGAWYQGAQSFWGVIIGFPLIIVGINLFLISLSTLILVIVNPFYNKTRCPFCKKVVEIRDGAPWKG